MADQYGTAYSTTDDLHRADGSVVNAGVRRFRNVFDLATAGSAANPLVAAKLPAGAALCGITVTSTADLSGITLAAGNADTADKYAAAAAGPNATRQEMAIKAGALDDDALAAPEDVLITPSGALPGAGIVVIDVFASKR